MDNKNMPAYPIVNEDGYCSSKDVVTGSNRGATGLTKREYFAAMAMQGMTGLPINSAGKLTDALQIPKNVAAWSVRFADELLKELEKQPA